MLSSFKAPSDVSPPKKIVSEIFPFSFDRFDVKKTRKKIKMAVTVNEFYGIIIHLVTKSFA